MGSISNDGPLSNPAAIIGMSFSFPQDAVSSDKFWSMLMQARCASEDFPASRLKKSAFYHSEAARQDSIPFNGGHFLEGSIAAFDAPFFSISASEAVSMDPLQRGLLEATYRALENAGLPLETVIGSKTSVYTGCFTSDWKDLYLEDPDQWPDYAATGMTALSMCANRISWFFNLRGTSANIDTACSSSLVALDMACKDLELGQAKMAIVAAGNLIYSPGMLHLLQSMNMLSVSSKCFSFDDRANGYARGEGFAVIVLKSLAEAIRARDTIRAVIRATGTNQDGRTQLVTQPSGDAQEDLIKETYKKAGLHPSSASYIEAHGTGTPVGDPIEANAIGKVFRELRKPENPLIVGAVKSNIGHLEGASGLAGLIKTVLILERGIIPPNANFRRENMAIDAEFLKIKFPTAPTVWPNDGPRIASVNSFGYGGSNAHVIVEDAYHYLRDHNMEASHLTVRTLPSQADSTESQNKERMLPISHEHSDPALSIKNTHGGAFAEKLLIFSAADEEGINRIAAAYGNHFRSSNMSSISSKKYLDSLSYTLDSRRSSLAWKSFGVLRSVEELQNIEQVISHPVRTNTTFKPSFTFIFTGQGAQWPRMGVELMERYTVFRHYLEICAIALKESGCPWDMIEELQKPKASSKIYLPEYSQPLCTALQIAYIKLLEDLNITPDTVVGHSSGEIAAAYSIGAISIRYAMQVAYYRGLLATDLEDNSKYPSGAMMAVGLSQTNIQPYFDAISTQYGNCALVVACINSQSSITVSGDKIQLASLESMLRAANIFARKLQVNVAYHSPLMNPIATKYLDAIGDMKEMTTPSSRKTPPIMVSSVTGDQVKAKDLRLGSYWVRNMLSAVDFLQAMNRLCQVQHNPPHKLDRSHRKVLTTNTLIEIGPHSALEGPAREIIGNAKADWIEYHTVLARNKSAIGTLLDTAGRLYCRGYSGLNFASLNRPGNSSPPACLADLPEYEFDHSHEYWWETRISKQYRLSGEARLDLLGKQSSDWIPHAPRWRNFIKLSEMPWTEHHKVNGSILYPAAGMLVMAIEAAHQIATSQSNNRVISGFSIKNAHFSRPLIIPTSSEGIETQFHLRKGSSAKLSDSNWSEFVLYAWENDQCMEICRGFVRVEYENSATSIKPALHDHNQVYEEATSTSSHQIDHHDFYQALNAKGYEFGRAFRSLDKISFNESGVSADVKVFEGLNREQQQPHIIHPSTLDGMIHLGLASLFRDGSISGPLAVPTFIERLWVSKDGLSSRESTTIKAATVGKQNLKTTSPAGAITEYSGSAVDERETKVLVKIDGLRLSAIESSSETETSKAEGPMCHSLSWFPDVSLLKGDEILTTCNRLTDVSESTSPSKIPIIQDLETVAAIFLARTFQTPIDSYPQEYLKKYALWAERHLNRFQLDSAGGESLKKLLEDDSASEELFRRVEAATARGKLIVKVGRNLRGILSGEVDPLWLLFGDPENLLLQTYSFFDETSDHWKKFLLYMKLLAHKNPNMDILEIGAGTGATTALVIDTFTQQQGKPQFSRYDFTDISASFFDEAKGRFGVHPGVGFKTLNIESDPGSQGFKDGFYDLIITSNVLHATKDMRATLTNVRRLLKPGGKLVLHEATNIEVLRTGFIFGTLPGWWLSDEAFRPWGATMTSKVWQELLVETGFSGIDMMFSDYESGDERESDIMVATASEFPPKEMSSALQHTPLLSNGSSKEQPHSRSNGNSSIIRNGVVKAPIRKRQMVHLIIDPTSKTQSIIARQIQQRCSLQNMDTDTELECRAYSLSEAAKLDKLDTTPCIFLLEIDRPFLYEMSKEEFADLQHILCSSLGNLWINCAGYSTQITPSYSLVDGMSRAIRSETSAIFITIAFCITNSMLSDSQVDNFFGIFSWVDFGSPDVTYEPMYVEADGTLNIGRVIESDSLNKEMAVKSSPEETKVQRLDEAPALRLSGAGNKAIDSSVSELPTFVVDQEFDTSLEPDEIEMKVHALGLQQKMSRSVSTQPSIEDFASLCWSGVVTRLGSTAASQYSVGDEVFMLKKEICKTHLRGTISCTSKLPPGMSLSDAAVLPIDFAVAWQCINGVARLESGESILIHEGTPSLLNAAIRISQHLGAEIFITISPDAKKTTLAERHGIPEDHIFYSDHDGSFAAALRRLGNQGVDVVLNSSIGESLSASWGLINPYGRFVDITQSAFSTEFELPMDPFKRGATLSSFNCADWMLSKPGQIKLCLEKFVEMSADCDGIFSARNPVETFPISKLNQASALMSKGQFANNVALQLNLSDEVSILSKREPTYSFDSDATYIIAGGLGSIGRATARWMTTRGAKNLILLSRSGAKSGDAQEFLSELCTLGINVAAPACDITSYSTLRDTLEHLSSKMPPIKGCIQASMVLSDSAFQSMTYSQWQNAAAPKTVGSWNLHQLLPSNLDFFILLSSISGIIGMPGQANYAAGNTFVDSLALHRVTQGQKAVSIALGVMDEDGYLTNDSSLKQSVLASLPATPISRSYYYDLLSHFCDPALKLDKESYNPIVGLRRQTATDTRNFQRAGSVWKTWFQSPLFSLVQNAASDSSSLDVSSSSKSLQDLFVQAQTPQEAVTVVLDALVSKIARMSGDIKEEMIEPMSAMHTYGVDSLVAIQIRKWLKREFGADVAVFDILGGGTFFGVAGIVVERSQLLKSKSRGV